MKRLIAILAVALVWAAACTKVGVLPEDGTYAPMERDAGPVFTLTLDGGRCVSIDWIGGSTQDVATSGRYPDYQYRASGQSYRFSVQAHFTAQDGFMASVDAQYVVDGVAVLSEYPAMQYRLISANFRQTKR